MTQCQVGACPLLTWCLAHGELHTQNFQVERCPECRLYQVQVFLGPTLNKRRKTAFTPQMTSLPPCFRTTREFDYRTSPNSCYCSRKCAESCPTLTKEAKDRVWGNAK